MTSDEFPDDSDGGFVSRLRVIEDQPLETRAVAFTQIHDALRSTLEGADASPWHG